MLVVLVLGALIAQVTPAITTASQQTVQTWDRHSCALLVCDPGEKGPPGRDGRDGLEGPKGDMGNQGLQGPRGIVGPPGRMGPPGPSGEKGCQGETGQKGEAGEIGPRGVRGLLGPPGSVGPAGKQGISGPPGEKGETGETGPIGATGAQGPEGKTGAAGPEGVKGSVGEKGEKGDVGARGLQGPAGVQGPVGSPGVPGVKGDTGSIGEKGTKGDSGLSEVNLMSHKVSTLEGQLLTLQATLSKFQKVALFPDGQMVLNKAFVTNGYEGTFDDLKQKCLQAGGQLASPKNAEENAAVQQIVILHKKSVFLGITDIQTEGKFKYLNGEAIVYSNWQAGEPNNDKGKENCVEVYVSGKWNDRSCGEKRLLVCEF